MIFSADAVVGTEDRSLASGKSFTIVVSPANGTPDNRVSFGTLTLAEVTRATVKGKLTTKFNSDNTVSGAFTARRCAGQIADPKTVFQADAAPDTALVGTWSGDELIDGASSGMTWTLSIKAGGTLSAQLKMSDGSLIEDADETWQSDVGGDVKRLWRQVAAARTDLNGLETKDTIQYCAYDVIDAKLALQCGTSHFPVESPTAKDAEILLTKK